MDQEAEQQATFDGTEADRDAAAEHETAGVQQDWSGPDNGGSGSSEETSALTQEHDASADLEQPAEAAADESQVLAAQLEAARKEAAENFDKYLRAAAELENYKKRALRERADLLRYAGENLARDLVEIVDDLDRAVSHSEAGSADDLRKGLQLIRERFMSLLEKHSISGEDAVGTPFDPTKFEAIATVPSAAQPPGTVIEQLRKAYWFKDRLLRPGQAVVSSGPGPETGVEPEAAVSGEESK